MYKSPIEVYTTELQTKINKHTNGVIMEAVKGYGVNVDKEELIRALQYDRQQYEKGYADGMKEFAERLKSMLLLNLGERISVVTADDVDNLLEKMEDRK